MNPGTSGLSRDEAVEILERLKGVDLHSLSGEFGITVASSSGKQNKGWAGSVIQAALGMPPDNLQQPDFGDWELKVVPVVRKTGGQLKFKETMAITMINPDNVLTTSFAQSHLLTKLGRFLLVARLVGPDFRDPSFIVATQSVNLEDLPPVILETIQADYEEVQEVLATEGLDGLSGSMGTFVQPRTKGAGHGSKSRAFYARTKLLSTLLDIQSVP